MDLDGIISGRSDGQLRAHFVRRPPMKLVGLKWPLETPKEVPIDHLASTYEYI
jgi:hypothetical protein